MMKHIHIYLTALMLAVLAASCSSTKNLGKGSLIGNMTEKEYVNEVITHASGWDALTAKMSLTVNTGSKSPTRLGGSLRMKRGEVIQLSVTYLLGIEVGRAEITPDGLRVIDRVNKRYVDVPFSELKALTNADLDFHTLQALFLNEIFLPGKEALTARDASAFRVLPEEQSAWLEVKRAKTFNYRFLTDTSDAQLKETRIGLTGTPYGLSWQYAKFRPLEQRSFPCYMNVTFEGGKKPVSATFELSRLSTDSDWDTQTSLSKKYERIELQELLKVLLK